MFLRFWFIRRTGIDRSGQSYKPPLWEAQPRAESLRSADWLYAGLLCIFAAVYMVQVDLYPTARYPNWDAIWVDVRTIGGLGALKDALLHGELPLTDPYQALGWSLAGNHHGPLGLFNLAVLVLSPARVMIATQFLVIAFGAVYGFLYLRRFSGNRALCFIGAMVYVSLPIVTSRYYYDQTLFGFILLPGFIYHAHSALQAGGRTQFYAHLTALSVWGFCWIGMCDIFFLETLPATVCLYSLVVSGLSRSRGWLSSLSVSALLALVPLLAGSYYTALLLETFVQDAQGAAPFVAAGMLPAAAPFVPGFFASMFWDFAAKSLILPIHGSGAFLYAPLFLYGLFVAGCIIRIRGHSSEIAAGFGLLAAGAWPFLLMAIFYSQTFHDLIPGVSTAATGRIRHLWNIWPFMLCLAAFVVISSLAKSARPRVVGYLPVVIGLVATVFEFLLYFVLDGRLSDPIYRITHENWSGFASANLIPLTPVSDPWIVAPLITLAISAAITLAFRLCHPDPRGKVHLAVGTLACVLMLLFVSNQNDLRLFQGGWQVSTASDYRIRAYFERKRCLDMTAARTDPNYRTLVAGAPLDGKTGRNYKLIAETELNSLSHQKTLYSWREMADPFTAMSLGLFDGAFKRRVELPPTTDQVLNNLELAGLLGVRWILSADQEIQDERLIHLATCSSPKGPLEAIAPSEKEGGSLFLYQLRQARPIAWFADRVEVMSPPTAARRIFSERQTPWTAGLALVDRLPHGFVPANGGDAGSVSIVKQTNLTMSLKSSATASRILVVSVAQRPNWSAYIDGQRAPILTVYGGLMGLALPPGEHEIAFVYGSSWLYWGLGISLAAMFGPGIMLMASRRRKDRPANRAC